MSTKRKNLMEEPTLKKISLQKLARQRDDSFLNVRNDYNMLKASISQYNLLYIVLGIAAYSVSLMNYPFQMYLREREVDKDEIDRWRYVFYYCWILKIVGGIYADIFFPFRLKYRGWIITACIINCALIVANLAHFDNTFLTCIVTAVVTWNLVFFDTLAQGIITVVICFDKRKFRLESLNLMAVDDPSVDSSTMDSPGNPGGFDETKFYVPTHVYYLGIYSCAMSFFRSGYLSTSFLISSDENSYYQYILMYVGVVSFILLLFSFNHKELQQTGWVLGWKGILLNSKIFVESFKTLFKKKNRAYFFTTLLIIGLLTANSVNYINETLIQGIVKNKSADEKVSDSTLSLLFLGAGFMVGLLYLLIVLNFKRINIDWYVGLMGCMLGINCAVAFCFREKIAFDNPLVLSAYLFVSIFVQSFMTMCSRLAIMDLLLRKLPSRSYGSMTFVSLLSIYSFACQTFSKDWQNHHTDKDGGIQVEIMTIWLAVTLGLYLVLRMFIKFERPARSSSLFE